MVDSGNKGLPSENSSFGDSHLNNLHLQQQLKCTVSKYSCYIVLVAFFPLSKCAKHTQWLIRVKQGKTFSRDVIYPLPSRCRLFQENIINLGISPWIICIIWIICIWGLNMYCHHFVLSKATFHPLSSGPPSWIWQPALDLNYHNSLQMWVS